jgi:hypothetical protein
MKKSATGLVALVLFIVVGTAHGFTFTGVGDGLGFTATGPGDNPGETLHASAIFTTNNFNLIVTLENTGTFDPNDPADVLTAIFFNIKGNPTLQQISAELESDSSVIAHPLPLGFDGNVGGEWTYRNSLTGTPLDANEGISSAALKWFKAKDLFPGENLQGPKGPGGVQFGITTLSDLYANDHGGLKHQGLIQTSVVFTLAGLPEGFELTDISNVTFQYGSNRKQPDITGEAFDIIPEPSTISLVAAGLLGALTLVRRRLARH